MKVTAIIAAGGRGQRFGGAAPKQLLMLGGRPMLQRSVELFLAHADVSEVVVALPPEIAADPPAYLRGSSKPLVVVAGGARRQDSVANGFRAADETSDVFVIHDAARPFASAGLVSRTIVAAAESGAAVAAMQARDTVKQSTHAQAVPGVVVRATLPRESIYLAQTPQAFRRTVLADALAGGARGLEATDEAALAERAGYTVRIVEGEASNIKVTTREDLVLAEALLQEGATGHAAGAARSNLMRVGTGYDLHRLVEGRPLILGGVTIPFERGLKGHSDADAVCHAVTDAVLGAAAAGDIGGHFPDTDARWRGASSVDLLRRAVQIVHERGFAVGNVDVVVIAERPRLAPYLDAMRAKVAETLGVSAGDVAIKGKTNEGVGEIGRGEAIAVHAVAVLHAR